MSSGDDPFGPGGKTVIRQNRGRSGVPEPEPGNGRSVPADRPNSTVFDPAGMPLAGWGASGTIIHQGAPFAENAAAAGGSASGREPRRADPAAKISQDAVLDASAGVEYPAANPIMAAAAPLLMFLGNLRLLPVEIQAAPLAERVASAIDGFERKIAKAGVSEEDARIAKFVLCETADDIIGNLPGVAGEPWAQHGVLSRFFQAGSSGAGFFDALNKLLADPDAHQDLLELMHACLSLGFEGQYRGAARPDGGLEHVRRDVYETLRFFKARGDDEISPHWQGLAATMAKPSARLPLWAVGATMCALLTGAFFVLRSVITNEGEALAAELLTLNPPTPVTIERAGFAPPAVKAEPAEEVKPQPPVTRQVDRIRAALAKDIQSGSLAVGAKGDFIVLEINNQLLFESGKAEVGDAFEPVAASIAAALGPEPGRIRIVGHTDNVKPRKSSVFKSNFDLSVARAKAVEKIMASKFEDPSRLAVEGKGEDEPIADNATAEGRARNRRVDVMIQREETL